MSDNTFLKKIQNKEMILGTSVVAGSQMITECMGQRGYDAIWIDLEHTHITLECLLNNLLALKATGTPSVVRVVWNDPVITKPVIDMGIDAVIFPCVCTAEEARKAVASCEYPPKGIRGFGPFRAADYFAGDLNEYIHKTSRNMARIIQIEHIDAVKNLREIAEVEGVDAFLVGPNDLAASLGYLGDNQNPEMLKVYDEIAEVLRELGKPFGVAASSKEEIIKQWKARGATIFFAGIDIEFIVKGADSLLDMMKNA